MSVRTGRAFGAALAIALALDGCAPKPTDVCRAPSAPRAEGPAELEEVYGDRAVALVPETNAAADYDFCLRSKAYAARLVQDSMVTVARAVTAQCEFKFDVWQDFRAGKWGKMNDSVSAVVAFERKEDEAAKGREALALVLEYRACAAGQTQKAEVPSKRER